MNSKGVITDMGSEFTSYDRYILEFQENIEENQLRIVKGMYEIRTLKERLSTLEGLISAAQNKLEEYRIQCAQSFRSTDPTILFSLKDDVENAQENLKTAQSHVIQKMEQIKKWNDENKQLQKSLDELHKE